MGVRNLWDILEPCKKKLPLDHLQNKRVCIDLSCWVVQLHRVNKSHCAINDKLYLKCLFHRLRALLAFNCTIIFVTDGSIPAIKLATYRRRLNSGHEVGQDETNSLKGSSLPRNMGSEFSCMIKEAKLLGLALGIPCLDGIEEAEAQCALLNLESLCDGCFTLDSDIFLFGARTVYRDICLERGYVICYEMEGIERKLGFGRNSLITLALLLGGDYSEGVHGLGPQAACQIVKSAGDNCVLQRIASEGMSFAKKMKNSKKQTQIQKCSDNSLESGNGINGSDGNLERQNQFLQVIDAYLKPKCHLPDSDAVYRALSQHPFQRAKLQEICGQLFGWPPEKTDEYTLPKVAERDLRRFAILHSATSNLGVKPSLYQIPVKCPVSAIVKHRKVKNRECFEVSWEGFDGLETSIVPAALIQKACPEKIAEFEERRAQEKKRKQRKPRTKKSENVSAASEIELKLQTLLLDDEPVSATASCASHMSEAVKSKDSTTTNAAEFINQENLNSKLESKTCCNIDMSSYHIKPIVDKSEVIDLLSPSPAPPSKRDSRFQQVKGEHGDVINLSDSETEMSLEHMKKARELRLFLASIRNEIS